MVANQMSSSESMSYNWTLKNVTGCICHSELRYLKFRVVLGVESFLNQTGTGYLLRGPIIDHNILLLSSPYSLISLADFSWS